MRGEVLHYDEGQGFGFITGQDGNRYTFAREDLRRATPMTKGTVVEFQASGGQARDVFSIRAMGQATATAPAAAETPAHFGRFAVPETPVKTGLFSYFMAGLTTNYANFSGRARRKEYWGYYLFWYLGMVLVVLAGLAIDSAIGNLDTGDEAPYVTILLGVLTLLASIVPAIAMQVRRQHDIGLSGWFYLLCFLPYVGSLILFVFALIPSQKHENKWGQVPQGVRI